MDRSLVEFHRKMLQQIDPPSIPAGAVLKQPDVQRVLQNHFFNLPAEEITAYQAKILRAVVERIQKAITNDEDEEVSHHLMTLLATLPRSRPEIDLSKTTVSYFPPVSYDEDVPPIKIHEAKKIIGSGPNTGLRTWEASLRLAHFLHSKPELVRGRSILELGAGTGFLSIFCAAYLSPSHVLVTDGHEDVLASLQENIASNASLFGAAATETPVTQKLFWGDRDDVNAISPRLTQYQQGREPDLANHPAATSPIQPNRNYDLILGADITYDPAACLALASTLSILATHNSAATILISATQRNLETMQIFLRACQDPPSIDGENETLMPLDVKEITEEEFQPPTFERQTGCFHNVVSPIRIWRLQAARIPSSETQ